MITIEKSIYSPSYFNRKTEKGVNMEIERKFLVKSLPTNLEQYTCIQMEQGYLCTDPVVRIRKENDQYFLTYKSKGFLSREEYNLPLTAEAYQHLKQKVDGNLIHKTRYVIPYGTHRIELDYFCEPFAPLVLVEVEFDSEEEAKLFTPPDWFGEEVTYSREYHNSTLSQKVFTKAMKET